MLASASKNFRLSSPLKIEEDAAMVTEKQGIVSILGTDSERSKAASLRRTLSADMSSRKWLAQNGFSPMKKTASSQQLPISVADSSASSSEREEEDHKVWRSRSRSSSMLIQVEQGKKEDEKPGQFDIWSSIVSQKANEDPSKLPPPYIHPLVKRSASSLSTKSLEICTESLGSETGSDGFSSYPSSESGDTEEDKEEVQQQQPQYKQQEEQEAKEFQYSFYREELRVAKSNAFGSGKQLPAHSFPPPLPSLARGDGPSLHMHSQRQNGRLVLEAVSVPSQNYFHTHRQEGRLRLTLVLAHPAPSQEPHHGNMEEDEVEEFEEQVFGNLEEALENKAGKDYCDDYCDEDDDDGEDHEEEMDEEVEKETSAEMSGAKEFEIVMEQAPKLSTGVINVHMSALMLKKLMGMENNNPNWPRKFKKAVNLMEIGLEEEDQEVSTPPLPQSLLPPPRVVRLIPSPPAPAAVSSFNVYEYFWPAKPAAASVPISICPTLENKCNRVILHNGPKAYEQQQLVLLTGNKAVDYFVPLFRGCKEPRRSLLAWEPHCIATS